MLIMIIVNIKGWTGNQLFQYAVGRALALKNNDILKIDTLEQNRHIQRSHDPRQIDLLKFNIVADIASDDEATQLRYPYGRISRLYTKVRTKYAPNFILNFDQNVLERKGDIYLDGYFQSYKYFTPIREKLLTEITLKDGLGKTAAAWQKQIVTKATTVSIHIRRGDYVVNEKVRREFGPCPVDYYRRAMAKLSETVINPTYVVFSDDIAWVKGNLPLPADTLYVSGDDISAVEDLMLMSQCTHHIIANSTFSWWGAWLNQNPSKQVVAPTPWLDNGHIKEADLLPPEWLQLPKYQTVAASDA